MHVVDDVSAAPASSRSRFVTYLRTGRRVPIEIAVTEGLKFNHQHDPANGQFTFGNGSNSGRQPLRGGGGASGGGGAGGSFRGGGSGGS